MSLIGLYEKATPKALSWSERLQFVKDRGFDFIEMSIDESDERLARLEWNQAQRKEIVEAIYASGIKILSLCLSGHRRFPFGSIDEKSASTRCI